MKYMSDQMLIEVYHRAIDLQLDAAFIELLSQELKQRNIRISKASA
ncbi:MULTISPECIES: sporulation histidine kinase inhibitor Sda [Brevibacillus]|uniref:Sporulation histidine kinase inhibitor Sda n=1 Tax=Brevibacillus invocatus TaxID=173959 RepID=A0A3M8CIK3_9BACL|nr:MULTISPECIES: sporulation histidine kinase inhibitor Sda [Brevibacillus]MCM3080285.1 sporulation histidine kinase inhibitor Sda [Brevibacillus invocatus]MCM3430462.1 sporulation histidine kinase inhibitor Sda [Brevibacillus invocatus]MDH4615814.1 sporulation histidine kinase inhibitor Sda [Brevibacillus sp. AY1]RNB75544.1 sporulation histidine kinase inhibitor Sda [Brevibacillus invocatus]